MDLFLPERMTRSLLLQVLAGAPETFQSTSFCLYMCMAMGTKVWVVYECVYVPVCMWLYLCAFLCFLHILYECTVAHESVYVCVCAHAQTHISVLGYQLAPTPCAAEAEGNLSQGSLCGGQAG